MEKEQKIEIARSFSRKLNLGNYETADFFCSQKTETTKEKENETSRELFEFCKKEVLFSIEKYKEDKDPNLKVVNQIKNI